MNSVLNIAFYKFVELSNLLELRVTLKEKALVLDLKGTVLISPEGINGSMAGSESAIRSYIEFLRSISEFEDILFKESFSKERPHKRTLVKIKKEIIPMGLAYIKPDKKTGARIYPKELKEWLDQGKEVVLLDTRNKYELESGTFKGAVDMGLRYFRHFPQKLEEMRSSLEGKPVVMFCTGGIRCEKATAYALSIGMENVYQLEGGILKYFEEVGNAHYNGNCFVFDYRKELDGNLNEQEPTSGNIND